MNILKTFATIQVDGTFSTCPPPFGQIYFIFGCTPCGKAIPAGYALLPDRNQSTYEKLFSALKKLIGDMSHIKYISVDFEAAVHNVVRSFLPTTIIFGCIFHLRQAVHRQITLKGLKSLYENSATIQEAMSLFYSLPFVPENEVKTVFFDVIMPFWDNHLDSWEQEFKVGEKVELFSHYLEKTYIVLKTRRLDKDPLFPINTWNKFNSLTDTDKAPPLTNNSVEAFNSNWTPCIPRSASVLTVIDSLIKEDALSKVTLMEQMRGEDSNANKKRRSDLLIRMSELSALCKNYNLREKGEFLRDCTRYL